MTACQAAVLAAGRERVIAAAGRTCYQPETRLVYLSRDIAESGDIGHILEALHECAHACQHRERPVLFALRNVWPVRLWLERDAWRRARLMACKLGLARALLGISADAGVQAHRSYKWPRLFVR